MGTGTLVLKYILLKHSLLRSLTLLHPFSSCNMDNGYWNTLLAARPAMMKAQRQSTILVLQLDAEEATLQWLLGFEDYSQDQHSTMQI